MTTTGPTTLASPLLRDLRLLGRQGLLGCLCLLGCLSPTAASADEPVALVGGTVQGRGSSALVVQNGKIVSFSTTGEFASAARRDVAGKCVTPGLIDSHVHLAYRQEAEAMASGGIAAAVDMGSPLAFLSDLPSALTVIGAGPMITAAGGYPTQTWGKDGFGIQVLGPKDAADAVDRLAAAGSKMVKIPFAKGRVLTEAELDGVMARARHHRMRVVAHALTDATALRAGKAGADVLAHTPNEPLSDETVKIWSTRAVISTLKAFGGSDVAVENLRRLRAAGATVLYGTDFGNSQTAGIDYDELALMGRAGMDKAAILASATTTPAAFWNLDDFGTLAIGKSDAVWVGSCDCPWCP